MAFTSPFGRSPGQASYSRERSRNFNPNSYLGPMAPPVPPAPPGVAANPAPPGMNATLGGFRADRSATSANPRAGMANPRARQLGVVGSMPGSMPMVISSAAPPMRDPLTPPRTRGGRDFAGITSRVGMIPTPGQLGFDISSLGLPRPTFRPGPSFRPRRGRRDRRGR